MKEINWQPTAEEAVAYLLELEKHEKIKFPKQAQKAPKKKWLQTPQIRRK